MTSIHRGPYPHLSVVIEKNNVHIDAYLGLQSFALCDIAPLFPAFIFLVAGAVVSTRQPQSKTTVVLLVLASFAFVVLAVVAFFKPARARPSERENDEHEAERGRLQVRGALSA